MQQNNNEPEWFQEVLDRTTQTQSIFTMWREGYDYPADDEDEGRDYYEEADEQHDKQQDQTLDQ